jgi:hypothetical protein
MDCPDDLGVVHHYCHPASIDTASDYSWIIVQPSKTLSPHVLPYPILCLHSCRHTPFTSVRITKRCAVLHCAVAGIVLLFVEFVGLFT